MNNNRSYIDLSEEEIKTIKNEILRVGTDNFNIKEYNISKDCYEILVEEIIAWGINSYEGEDYEEEYWDEIERQERDSLYHDDE